MRYLIWWKGYGVQDDAQVALEDIDAPVVIKRYEAKAHTKHLKLAVCRKGKRFQVMLGLKNFQ